MNQSQLSPAVRIGHVHLRVADLERAMAFYHDVLGFSVTADARAFGLPMVLLAAGDYHHHIALNTFMSEGGTPAPAGHAGLHHVALLYPNRCALACAVQQLLDREYPLDSAEDHGGTVSVYLRDPDSNGIELYYDRPRETWFGPQGQPILKAEPFDPRDLLADIHDEYHATFDGGSMTTEQNKAIARRWTEELWGQGQLAVADEIIAPDYVRHDPGDPFPAVGPDDVKRIVSMLRAMLPDFRLEIEDMLADGDKVVSRYTATATDTKGYMGMPPTGKQIRTSAIQIFRFAGGKIVESWAARDDLGTLQQLGHLPPREPRN
ncbi:MAG: ester cyclase [Roseiflexaceae bacterium]